MTIARGNLTGPLTAPPLRESEWEREIEKEHEQKEREKFWHCQLNAWKIRATWCEGLRTHTQTQILQFADTHTHTHSQSFTHAYIWLCMAVFKCTYAWCEVKEAFTGYACESGSMRHCGFGLCIPCKVSESVMGEFVWCLNVFNKLVDKKFNLFIGSIPEKVDKCFWSSITMSS